MDYRLLGRTGVRVSSLCFGTMSFGTTADEEASAAMFHDCLDAGVNMFDTANVYGQGRSERILGGLIQEMRDDLVIASKVFGRMGEGPNDGGLSRRHVTRAVEQSLRRLGTDRLDLYYLHQFDPDVPIEETLRALDGLVREVLILYPASTHSAAGQIANVLGASATDGVARFDAVQPMYNLVKRQAEVEILPLAASEGLAVFPYSPVGGGLLSGKYGPDTRPDRGRLVENENYARRYGRDTDYLIAERFTAYAQEQGVHPVTLAVAWVGSHPAVTAPILGARDTEQLAPALAAGSFEMTERMRDEITALTPEVPPAHDRREEAL
jgi:aryl-alcohol dehydrogenase-like predicted oxidoreductase